MMLLRGITEDSTTRRYIKSGVYSKKTRQYLTDGEFNNIVLSLKKFDEWISKSRKGDKIMYVPWPTHGTGGAEALANAGQGACVETAQPCAGVPL